jgi:hypothetical protein
LREAGALFHPDTPTDVGPRGFSGSDLSDGMPRSPIRFSLPRAAFGAPNLKPFFDHDRGSSDLRTGLPREIVC